MEIYLPYKVYKIISLNDIINIFEYLFWSYLKSCENDLNNLSNTFLAKQ